MSVKLRRRKNNDGSTSQYLDVYHNGKRSYEFLHLLKLEAGNTPEIRQRNKENKLTAETLLHTRAKELAENDYNITAIKSKSVLVMAWMRTYEESYKKKDKRNITGVINRFEKFLDERKQKNLLMKDFTENIVHLFKEKLQQDCKGEGAKSYFSRFRKMVKQAVRENLLLRNPCEFVSVPKGEARVKDTLTFEELQKLAETPTEAKEMKCAFLYCTVTGLRFCDVEELNWKQIDLEEKLMRVKQLKTGKIVEVPLGASALALLRAIRKKEGKVFDLPSANGCNKSLQKWVDRAKIEKKITWHAARHTLGFNLILSGASINTVSDILGHASLQHTKRYVRKSRELNQKAIDSLPALSLNPIVNEEAK